MNWKIIETNQLAPQDVDRQGNKMLIGNGYIGYRGTLEEFNKAQKTATIVAGLYDQVGDQWREPVNMPNGCFVQVSCNGEPLHALTSEVVSHWQGIDMQTAVHQRETTFATADGTQVTVRARRFASLTQLHLLCLEYTVTADRPCTLTVRTGIDSDVWDINGPHLRDVASCVADGIISVTAVTHETQIATAVSETIHFPKNPAQQTISGSYREFTLQNGGTFYKFVSHDTGLDEGDVLVNGRFLCQEAAAIGFDALLAAHTARWAKRWQACNIQIAGDDAADEALRFSLYHLLSIVPTDSETVSIPARGMSGQMYKGAIFWDTEIFMLPFFMHTLPQLARNLLLYRYHTLDGARRKAQGYGYRGAFYAWESQDTGDDACTLFNVTDVFTNRPLRTYFRDKQIHINGDIVYALWHYFTSTGDATIWTDGGAEIVFECARFYLSYAYYHPDKKRYELLDVTGPDEYHERIHNNTFTNRMVAHTMEICLQLNDWLRDNQPQFRDELIAKLQFEAEFPLIAEIAEHLYLPDAVGTDEIIPQFDDYFTLEDVSLPDLLTRKQHPHEYLGAGCGLATTTQIIKQADVVLMLYLFNGRYTQQTKVANWEYYEPRTEHGSSLSASSYSIVAAQIGKIDWAYKYFMKTATIDLTGIGKQYVGTLYIGGTHPAANGGSWMSAVYGLCGIRCQDNTIFIQPNLPQQWQKIIVPFTFRGQIVRITLTDAHIQIESITKLTETLFISINDNVYSLTAETLNVALKTAVGATHHDA